MAEPKDEGEAPPSARDVEGGAIEEGAERRDFRSIRPPKPLDEDLLDELSARIATLPEPVAALAIGVEIARAEGDVTGVRKRLFELGIGVVRYGFSAGLAALAAKLGDAAAPRPVAEALARAARISDGMWCELTRNVGNTLKAYDPAFAHLLAFTSQRPLTELVTARNDFIHRGGSGDNALEKLMALLEGTEGLLSLSLRCVASVDPPAYEARMGTPLRGGVWRKTKGPLPEGVESGVAYLVREDGTWMPISPYLPLVDKRLLFADGPHAPGKPWRSTDPEIGEHREHQPIDRAVRKLVGEDKNAPQELADRPKLVGREVAVKTLERAAEEAAAGSVRVALVTGSFGVGRTRVADEIVAAAAAYGFGRVIDARCSVERKTPLRALRTAIEGMKGLGRLRDAIERALSVEGAMTRAAIEASMEAIEEALVEASLEEPTVLDMDDAQWADEHTLGVLRMLTDRAIRKGRGRLFVIVTVRDEPNPSAALRRFVGRVEQGIGAGATRVMLDALAAKDAAKLVQNVAPMARAIESVVVDRAGGVPFFLVQPLLVWNETGALAWRDAAWHPRDESILRASVPGVRDLLRARLDSFFDPGSDGERAAQHVLACVALYGAGLPVEQLVAAVEAAGPSARAVEQALELLVESGLLLVRGERQEYGFAQEIMRQAALEDVRHKPWFRRMHRSLLETVGASAIAEENAAFLAAGYESLGERDEAARWYGEAVAGALGSGEFERAIELGERLALIAKGAVDRARAELRVVQALVRAGRAAEARGRLELISLDGVNDVGVRLEARILTHALAAVLRHLPADFDAKLVEDADAYDTLSLRIEARIATAELVRGARGLVRAEEALALAADAPWDLRYRTIVIWLDLLIEVDPTNIERLQRAASIAADAARKSGSVWAELEAQNFQAIARSNTGDFQGALVLFEHIAERAKALRFGTLLRMAFINIATSHLRAGNLQMAATTALTAATVARDAGEPDYVGGAQSVRADALLRLGDLVAARAAIDEAVEHALVGKGYRASLALLRRVEILEKLGEPGAAVEDAELALSIAEADGNIDHKVRASVWLGLLALREGSEGGRERLERALDEAGAIAAKLRSTTNQLIEQARGALAH